MKAPTITKGSFTYRVDRKTHAEHMRRVKGIPEVLERIGDMGRSFVGKPQFYVAVQYPEVQVIREDFASKFPTLQRTPEKLSAKRLTVSEWRILSEYRGFEVAGLPMTLHDVFVKDSVTIKTGNPLCNNSFEEFFRALNARCLGMVEAKSPIGFTFDLEDPYGINSPGKMFYKHLTGMDLEEAIRTGTPALLNWALWETGKFFSRLMHSSLYLEDSDRLGNYFIEKNPSSKVFRFLDLEKVEHLPGMPDKMKVEMLMKFIKKATEQGFLTPERLGEFVIVCLGDHTNAANLLKQAL